MTEDSARSPTSPNPPVHLPQAETGSGPREPSEWKGGRHPGSYGHGDYTLVEHPEPDNRGLAVRSVTAEEQAVVRRAGGFLFPTASAAEEFARGEMLYGDEGPPLARQAFSHKRIDGLRLYVQFRGAV